MSQLEIQAIPIVIGIALNHFLTLWAIVRASRIGEHKTLVLVAHLLPLMTLAILVWAVKILAPQ
jgi:hypothetical protein